MAYPSVGDETSVVRRLEWENQELDRPASAQFRLLYIFLRFLPPTLVEVNIKHHTWIQKDDMNTRCLPRLAVHVTVVACKLIGSVDMTCLPVNLIALDLQQNRLQGTVRLKHLPPSLKVVYLQANPFEKVIVYNDSLPMGLQEVNFFSSRKIRCEESQNRPVDDRVVVVRQKR